MVKIEYYSTTGFCPTYTEPWSCDLQIESNNLIKEIVFARLYAETSWDYPILLYGQCWKANRHLHEIFKLALTAIFNNENKLNSNSFKNFLFYQIIISLNLFSFHIRILPLLAFRMTSFVSYFLKRTSICNESICIDKSYY